MQEPEVVAAIVAGDPSGLTEVLDTYAAPLFAYCRGLLPGADAAEVVTDTFAVAREKLGGLRDPARLGSWLEAVARNECHRRLIARAESEGEGDAPAAAIAGESAARPEGLTGRILKICTDETPTGRAHRTTVAHLAGPFGHDGFPKPVGLPKKHRATQQATQGLDILGQGGTVLGGSGQRRRPSRLLIVTGVMAAVIVLIGAVIAISKSGGAHPDHVITAAATGPQATDGAGGTGPSSIPPASTGAPPQATRAAERKPTAHHRRASPSATSAPPAPAQPTAPPPSSPARKPITKPTQPTAGVVTVSPGSLSLDSVKDVPTQGTVTITASGGAVRDYSVSVSSSSTGHVLVTPSTGSLGSGQHEQLQVTAWGKASFYATITISPGNASITVSLLALKSAGKAYHLQHAQLDAYVAPGSPGIGADVMRGLGELPSAFFVQVGHVDHQGDHQPEGVAVGTDAYLGGDGRAARFDACLA
jgi:hypothetical protein